MSIIEQIRDRIAHMWKYITVLAKWLALGWFVGLVGGAVGAAFHLGVEWVTEVRLAHPQILWFLRPAW